MSTVPDAGRKPAAFFDVDGTLVQTTIVHYYVYFRRRRMSPLVGTLWYAIYLIKCTYYMLLDRIDRSKLNIVFYRSYAGLSAAEIKAQADDCYRDVIKPRQFAEGVACVGEHRKAGHEIVLVTGSIDFIMEPLAALHGRARRPSYRRGGEGPPYSPIRRRARDRSLAVTRLRGQHCGLADARTRGLSPCGES
jgi:phosphoserine phosphatase